MVVIAENWPSNHDRKMFTLCEMMEYVFHSDVVQFSAMNFVNGKVRPQHTYRLARYPAR